MHLIWAIVLLCPIIAHSNGATLAPPLPPTKVVAAALRESKQRYYAFSGGEGGPKGGEINGGGSYNGGQNKYPSGDPFEVPSLSDIGKILRERDDAGFPPRSGEHQGGWGNRPPPTKGWGNMPPPTKGWGWPQRETTTWAPPPPPGHGWGDRGNGGSRYGLGSYGNDRQDESSRYWGWHDSKTTTTEKYNPRYLASDEAKYRPIRYPSFTIGSGSSSSGGGYGNSGSDSGYGRPVSSLWSSAAAGQSGGYGQGQGSYSSSGRSWGQSSPHSSYESNKGRNTPYRRGSNEQNYNYRPPADTGWGSGERYPRPRPSPPSWEDDRKDGWGWPKSEPSSTHSGWGRETTTRPQSGEGWGWPEPTRPPWPPTTTEGWGWETTTRSKGEGWGWAPPTRAPRPRTTTKGWGWPEPTRPTKTPGWGWGEGSSGHSDKPSRGPSRFDYKPDDEVYERPDYPPGIQPPEVDNYPPFQEGDFPDQPNHYRIVSYTPSPEEIAEMSNRPPVGGGWSRDDDEVQKPQSSFAPSYGNFKGADPPPFYTKGQDRPPRPQGNNKGGSESENPDKWFNNHFQRGKHPTTHAPVTKAPRTRTTVKSTPRPLDTMVRRTYSTSQYQGPNNNNKPKTTPKPSTTPKPRQPPPKLTNSVTESSAKPSSKKSRYDEHGFKYIPYDDPHPMSRKLATVQKDIYESLDYTNGGEKRDRGDFGEEVGESRHWGRAVPQPWSRSDPVRDNHDPFGSNGDVQEQLDTAALDSERKNSNPCPLGQMYSEEQEACVEPRTSSAQATTMKSRINLFK